MAGPTSKSAWTAFERWVAKFWNTTRNPLSGANNRQADGSGRPGDVILDNYDAVVECKYRATNAQHSLYRIVQADAKKHGLNPQHCFLYTHVKREKYEDGLVTMSATLFHEKVLPILQPSLLKQASLATSSD